MEPIVWVAIIGVAGTLMTSTAGVIVSLLNRKKVEDLHQLINSNLTRQIEASIAEALARGIATGVEQERKRSENNEP